MHSSALIVAMKLLSLRKRNFASNEFFDGRIGIGTNSLLPDNNIQLQIQRKLHVLDSISTGNIGIGTTTPQAKLHVQGTTFAAGNVGIGTQTTRQLLDVQGGSAIVSGNIGIGTTLPQATCHVVGNIFSTGTVTASNMSILGDFVTLNTVTSNTEQMIIENSGTGPALKVTQTGANSIAEFYDDGGAIAFKVANDGLIGIGTTTPRKLLDVQGGDMIVSGNVGVGTTAPSAALHVRPNSTTAGVIIDQVGTGGILDVRDGGVSKVVVDGNGNVGIGTTLPIESLHIQGNALVSGNISAGNLGMFRNRIINGNFDIWQRGTSFNVTLNATYTADRWRCAFDGTGATRTVSQQAFTLGQTDVPNEPSYFFRYNQSVAGTGGNYNVLQQPIESVRNLAGQTATISFYAKADATRGITVQFRQEFGAGGSASVFTTPNSVYLSTSWTKYTVTTTVPSISGKTLGTNNCLILEIYFPRNTIQTIDIAQVQVEKGNITTPFELRPYPVELQLCQRYYEVIKYLSSTGGEVVQYYGPAGWQQRPRVALKVTKRAVGSADYIDANRFTAASALTSGPTLLCDTNFLIISAVTTGANYLYLNGDDVSIGINAEL